MNILGTEIVGILRKYDGKTRYSVVKLDHSYDISPRVSHSCYRHNGKIIDAHNDRRSHLIETNIDGFWTSCSIIKNPLTNLVYTFWHKLVGRYI